jgi:hypothetical protein
MHRWRSQDAYMVLSILMSRASVSCIGRDLHSVSTPSWLIRTPFSTPCSRDTDNALAGLCTCTPLSLHLANIHRQNLSGSICAVVPSRLMTSMLPSFVHLSHSGPTLPSSPNRSWLATCALLFPLSNQSSPLPLTASSLS